MDHDETGCHPAPEGPIFCANNCGFFGSAANMNLCSVCYKDLMQKEERSKLAALSIGNLANGASVTTNEKKHILVDVVEKEAVPVKVLNLGSASSQASSSAEAGAPAAKEGPSRCGTCKKKVGLTGFKCRCGNIFCGAHRYSDKHDCQFDYLAASQDAIAKANPVIKAEKLDKI